MGVATQAKHVDEPPSHDTIYIPRDRVKPGTNYRRDFPKAKLLELAASLSQQGQLEPACVRTKGDGYEIVFGERRYRALLLTNIPKLWAYVRDDLTDAQVLELQLAENHERDDVHELDEAQAYEDLVTKYGRTTKEIAERVQRSHAYVLQRMKLLALVPALRTAFREGTIGHTVAYQLARVPTSLQVEALKEIQQQSRFDGGEVTAAQTAAVIQRRYMLRLAEAPFDRGDATLVPTAGTCAVCPKRTGNQRELFADVKSPDLCTDPVCWADKLRAHGARLVEKARSEGREVLEKKQAEKLFVKHYGDKHATSLAHSSNFRELDESTYLTGKTVTFRELVKRAKDKAPSIVLAVDGAGVAHELVRETDVAVLTRSVSAKQKKERGSTMSASERAWAEKQKKEAARAKAEKARERAVLSLLVEREGTTALDEKKWHALALCALEHMTHDRMVDVRARRGWGEGHSGDVRNDVRARVSAMKTSAEAKGFVLEALVAKPYRGLNEHAVKVFGLTPAIVKKRLVELEAAAKAKKSGKASSAKVAKKGEATR